jgi:hypothetical protein
MVSEFIDPVFAKTSPKRSFSITKNERIGLVFAKTGSINSDGLDFVQLHNVGEGGGAREECKRNLLGKYPHLPEL